MRSAGCFLLSLLSMFMVLNVSAASRFGCVAILDFYFSAYLLVASLTVGIPRSTGRNDNASPRISRVNTTTGRLLTIPFRGIAKERIQLIDTGAGINLIKENKSDTKIFKSDEPQTFYMGQEKYFTDRFVGIIAFGKPHKFCAVPNDFPLIEDGIIGLPCLEQYQYEISNDKIRLDNNVLYFQKLRVVQPRERSVQTIYLEGKPTRTCFFNSSDIFNINIQFKYRT